MAESNRSSPSPVTKYGSSYSEEVVGVQPTVPPSYQNYTTKDEDASDRRSPSPRGASPDKEGEEEVLVHGSIKVYRSRIWILGAFSFMAMFQCLQWNTWGPISASMDAAYPGWGPSTVAMMANWGTITFVIFIIPMCYLINEKGIRAGVFTCAIMIAGGTVIRVLAFTINSTTVFTISCHLCAILVGTSGTLVMAAPPMIAAEWFPPKERTTATAIGQCLNQLGNAGSYIEPLFVRSPEDASPEEIRSDIKKLMYIYAGIGVALLLAIFIYYPSKPPTPPSVSSSIERLQFWHSLKRLIRNRDVVLIVLAYGVSVGVPSAWVAVFNFSLQSIGIDQDEAMWIALSFIIISGACALVSGRMTDLVYGHVRISLIVIIIANLGCYYWFYLISYGTIPVIRWQVYVTAIGAFSLNFATCPLFFELAVESAYPCPEIVVGGLLTGMNNLVGLSFLFLFFIPNIGFSWVTYVLLASCSLSLIPITIVKEDYSRSNLDRGLGVHSSYQPI